jgi:hypothetical protein
LSRALCGIRDNWSFMMLPIQLRIDSGARPRALDEHDGGNDEERDRIEREKDQRRLPRRRHWYLTDRRRKPIGIQEYLSPWKYPRP